MLCDIVHLPREGLRVNKLWSARSQQSPRLYEYMSLHICAVVDGCLHKGQLETFAEISPFCREHLSRAPRGWARCKGVLLGGEQAGREGGGSAAIAHQHSSITVAGLEPCVLSPGRQSGLPGTSRRTESWDPCDAPQGCWRAP